MTARADLRRGGRGKCAACSHPESAAITAALMTGKPSQQKLADKYGIDRSSLQAHKQHHLSPALVAMRQQVKQAGSVAAKVEMTVTKLESVIAAAEKAKNTGQMLAAIREMRPYLETLAKITGELDERASVVVNVATSQEWIDIRTAIFRTLLRHPTALHEVTDQLRQMHAA